MFLSFENRRNWCKDMSKALLHCLLLNLSHFVHLIFWEARSELLLEISVSSIYAFVFLSGLWERMTNDKEGLTSHSLKPWERYDLSLLLTCAISLHTYSNSWLNLSLFPRHFFIHVLLHFPRVDLYSRIEICCLYTGAVSIASASVEKEWIWILHDNAFD